MPKKHRARVAPWRTSGQRGLEELSQTASVSTDKPPTDSKQDDHSVPIAWAHIFVSRLGNVGLWTPRCPFCGLEHVLGGYAPSDIVEVFKKLLDWQTPHCRTGPPLATWGVAGYQLDYVVGPVVFAPGARNSRLARSTMKYLRSIGLKSSNKALPSDRSTIWWRHR
jgi:hypothetical protein